MDDPPQCRGRLNTKILVSDGGSKAVVLVWSLLAVLVSEFDVSLYVCSLYFEFSLGC